MIPFNLTEYLKFKILRNSKYYRSIHFRLLLRALSTQPDIYIAIEKLWIAIKHANKDVRGVRRHVGV